MMSLLGSGLVYNATQNYLMYTYKQCPRYFVLIILNAEKPASNASLRLNLI